MRKVKFFYFDFVIIVVAAVSSTPALGSVAKVDNAVVGEDHVDNAVVFVQNFLDWTNFRKDLLCGQAHGAPCASSSLNDCPFATRCGPVAFNLPV